MYTVYHYIARYRCYAHPISQRCTQKTDVLFVTLQNGV